MMNIRDFSKIKVTIFKKSLSKKRKKKYWQRPIFANTIVGAEVLNFCVRDGYRWVHFANITNI